MKSDRAKPLSPGEIVITVAAVIQARMGSTRFPGKVLHPLAGTPMMEHIINRLLQVTEIEKVMLAIPDLPSEKPLEDLGRRCGIEILKGPENDVLGRFILAGEILEAENLLRVCGDDPFIDLALVRSLIRLHLERKADYTITPVAIPLGTGTELVRLSALRRVAGQTSQPIYREHVTTYFHDHPGEFTLAHAPCPRYLQNKNYRLTMDAEQDLLLADQLYRLFSSPSSPVIDMEQVIEHLDRHPQLALLNSTVAQKNWRDLSP